MQYTINQLYELLSSKIDNIYEIFKNFFGADNVDIHNRITKAYIVDMLRTYCNLNIDYKEIESDKSYDITDTALKAMQTRTEVKKATVYVYWKEVTVTNENGRSVNIQDLYAKIDILYDGTIPYENTGFTLNRATYTRDQFLSDYMHSHIKGIPKGDFSVFMNPCLGSGPIKNTIATLKNDYDETMWMLFCQELSMYVTVESLAGIPWRYLENIGTSSILWSHRGYNKDEGTTVFSSIFYSPSSLKRFIEYYLKNGHLSISFKDGQYICGMTYTDYIIDVSNSFIDYYNKYLSTNASTLKQCFERGLLYNCIVKDNKFYQSNASSTNTVSLNIYKNQYVLTFKGKLITTDIIDPNNREIANTVIINHCVAMFILNSILKVINFRYRNEHNFYSPAAESSAASDYKKVLYI